MFNFRKNKKIIFVIFLAVNLILPSIFSVAKNRQKSISEKKDEINELNNKANQLKSQKQKERDNLHKLKNENKKLKSDVNNISGNIDSVKNDIESAKNNVESAKKELDSISTEVKKAEESEKKQYNILKKHIVYMYENSRNHTLLNNLLSSKSIAEFLSKSEYANEINKYDRKIIKKYKEITKKLKEKSTSLKNKQKEMSKKQENLAKKQEELSALLGEAKGHLDENTLALNSSETSIDEIDKEIKGYKSRVYQIEQEVSKANEAIANQIVAATQNGSNNNVVNGQINNSQGQSYQNSSELNELAAIVYAEAGNQGYDGMLAVASVIMNRVFYKGSFPNTIHGVIMQPHQFEPTVRKFVMIKDGKKVLSNQSRFEYYSSHPEDVSQLAKNAADAALRGERYNWGTPPSPMNQLFFMTPGAFSRQKWLRGRNVQDKFTLKGHTFFNVY